MSAETEIQAEHDDRVVMMGPAIGKEDRILRMEEVSPANSPRFILQREGALWSLQRDNEPKSYGTLEEMGKVLGFSSSAYAEEMARREGYEEGYDDGQEGNVRRD